MVDEMEYLHKNEAWDLVELLAGRKPIGSKWVFKKKTNAEGNVENYKARLVAKGYSQVEQMDVKKIFLHGDMEEEIYMKQLEGFVVKGKKELVYLQTREGALDNIERVFRYFHGTSDYGLFYQGRLGLDRVLDIRGFVDVDWAEDLDYRTSTSGYVFNLFGGVVNWMSKKQDVVAL
eukprot:PITA_11629